MPLTRQHEVTDLEIQSAARQAERLSDAPPGRHHAGEDVVAGVVPPDRRDAARKTLFAEADKLGINPLQPPLPAFSAGEDLLTAATRLVRVRGLEKEVERHRAQTSAWRADADRIAAVEARAEALRQEERDRCVKSWAAGKEAGPPPPGSVAELAAIEQELPLSRWVRRQQDSIRLAPERKIVMDAIVSAGLLPSVILVGELVVERMRALTADMSRDTPAFRTYKVAVGQLKALHDVAKHPGNSDGDDLVRAVRKVRTMVANASLHLYPLQQPTAEELNELDIARAAPR